MRDDGWVGRRALDAAGAVVGVVVEVAAAPDGTRWALVRTRRFPPRRRAVPLAGASSTRHGIVVAHPRAAVRAAPAIDRGPPSAAEARRLTEHYVPAGRPPAPAPAADAPPDPAIEQARAEARHTRQRLDLYRAKAYSSRPTSARRLRELERESAGAQERLIQLLGR